MPRQEVMRPKVMDTAEKDSVDVFAFMERDEESWDSQSPEQRFHDRVSSDDEDSASMSPAKEVEASQIPSGYSDLEVRASQDAVQRSWGRSSLHSDSGISVHSGSPDQDSPILQHKFPMMGEGTRDRLEPTAEIDEPHLAKLRDSPDHSTHRACNHELSPSMDSHPEDVPEAYFPSPEHLPQHAIPMRQLEMPEMPSRPIRDLVHRRPRLQQRKTGYEYLASNLSSHNDTVLKPIYRKFETLNNRMLLYLQDEISEIEEQLRDLDAAIAQEEADLGRGPVSRRSEAKLPSQLQWHRLDLLGRSFAKVEQYSKS